MNYTPPYMNYNQGYQGFDGNAENKAFKQDYFDNNMTCPYGNNDFADYKCCNQVEESCQYVDVPHYVNYHTHNIMNVYKRHYIIPTCSESSEVRVFDINPYQANFSNQGFNNGLNNFFVPFR